VWVNGPYPCGSWPDLSIFRHRLVALLAIGEWVLADEGYLDGQQFVLNKKWRGFPVWWKREASRALAKHEWVNSQIKKFKILSTTYRNGVLMHEDTFKAIANVVQIQLVLSDSYQEYRLHYDDRQLFNDDGSLIL